MNKNFEMMLKWKRKERPAAQIYGGLCSAPFHFKHFDELLADMGATKKKRGNPVAEQFAYPNAKAYGKFLASTPQCQAGSKEKNMAFVKTWSPDDTGDPIIKEIFAWKNDGTQPTGDNTRGVRS